MLSVGAAVDLLAADGLQPTRPTGGLHRAAIPRRPAAARQDGGGVDAPLCAGLRGVAACCSGLGWRGMAQGEEGFDREPGQKTRPRRRIASVGRRSSAASFWFKYQRLGANSLRQGHNNNSRLSQRIPVRQAPPQFRTRSTQRSHSSLPAALRPRVLWKKPAVSCVPRSTPHICRSMLIVRACCGKRFHAPSPRSLTVSFPCKLFRRTRTAFRRLFREKVVEGMWRGVFCVL